MRPRRVNPLPVPAAVMLAAILPSAGCDDTPDAPVLTVYAAASTTDVLTELARRFEDRHGVEVRLSFASSATGARQIEAGARADVFVSASVAWMDHVQQLGLVDPVTRRPLLRNELVVVVPRGDASASTWSGWGSGPPAGPVAIGDPAYVPAGRYARAALRHAGWYDVLEPRLVLTVDVRAALRLAELGEVSAALVYATDADASEHVEVVHRFEPAAHEPIIYTIAVCHDAPSPDLARSFLDELARDEAAAVFRAAGFRLP